LDGHGTECGELTMVEIRDGFQNMAVGIQCLRSTDPARRVPAREQDDLGVYERPRADAVVQCLAEGKCGGHPGVSGWT